ncbi:MAG: glycosyltransferase, partial [Proteobacteria bacterium]
DPETAMRNFAVARRRGLSDHDRNWLDRMIEQSRRTRDERLFEHLPQASPPVGERKLTIGMATYDDYDGVYFSVMAIRLYHPEITDDTEILVVDNNPGGRCSKPLRSLADRVSGLRYVPVGGIHSTAVRDVVFNEASGDYVLCIDSHVMLAPGSIRRFIDFLDRHPDCEDLLQGPLLDDSTASVSTHFAPVWRAGMYGVWDRDPRGRDPEGAPFEIPMQGLGLFGCRRRAWPGFNPKFRGFGGEEGYIHEKFRRAGRKALCLPFLRWIHRFDRPEGAPYKPRWRDRYRNYMIGFEETGLDTRPIDQHFETLLGRDELESLQSAFREEKDNPFYFFDAIFCINIDHQTERWSSMQDRFRSLGIEPRVTRFSAVETPGNHHVGCALSHRFIIEQAKRLGLRNVLVFEDDAVFHRDTLALLGPAVRELAAQDWALFYLGGHKWNRDFPLCDGCSHLEAVRGVTTTHAIAYHHSIFDKLLHDVPGSLGEVEKWLEIHAGIDQYLARLECAFMARPTLATQPAIAITQDTWPKLAPTGA